MWLQSNKEIMAARLGMGLGVSYEGPAHLSATSLACLVFKYTYTKQFSLTYCVHEYVSTTCEGQLPPFIVSIHQALNSSSPVWGLTCFSGLGNTFFLFKQEVSIKMKGQILSAHSWDFGLVGMMGVAGTFSVCESMKIVCRCSPYLDSAVLNKHCYSW